MCLNIYEGTSNWSFRLIVLLPSTWFSLYQHVFTTVVFFSIYSVPAEIICERDSTKNNKYFLFRGLCYVSNTIGVVLFSHYVFLLWSSLILYFKFVIQPWCCLDTNMFITGRNINNQIKVKEYLNIHMVLPAFFLLQWHH